MRFDFTAEDMNIGRKIESERNAVAENSVYRNRPDSDQYERFACTTAKHEHARTFPAQNAMAHTTAKE